MPNVIADPEKLRRFASQLTNSAGQLESIARQLRASLAATAPFPSLFAAAAR